MVPNAVGVLLVEEHAVSTCICLLMGERIALAKMFLPTQDRAMLTDIPAIGERAVLTGNCMSKGGACCFNKLFLVDHGASSVHRQLPVSWEASCLNRRCLLMRKCAVFTYKFLFGGTCRVNCENPAHWGTCWFNRHFLRYKTES